MRKGRPERVIPFAALAEVNAGRSIRATATKFDIGYGRTPGGMDSTPGAIRAADMSLIARKRI